MEIDNVERDNKRSERMCGRRAQHAMEEKERKKVSGEETNIIPSSCRNQPGVMMMCMHSSYLHVLD